MDAADDKSGGMQRINVSLDDLRSCMKHKLTLDRPYADRLSIGMLFRLLRLQSQYGKVDCILREIDFLEGINPHSQTKPEEQFKHHPLTPFWHKHYYSSRQLLRNIGIRWGVEHGGNRDLDTMLAEVSTRYGNDPDMWQKALAYDFVLNGLEDRANANRLTGDWIVFGRHRRLKYYLDLATHSEAWPSNAQKLYKKLRDGSEAEFPCLFE
jgi:hypothetical protein